MSITPLIDTEDACFDLNASRPIAKGDLKWRDALLVAHRVNSNVLSAIILSSHAYFEKYINLFKIQMAESICSGAIAAADVGKQRVRLFSAIALGANVLGFGVAITMGEADRQ